MRNSSIFHTHVTVLALRLLATLLLGGALAGTDRVSGQAAAAQADLSAHVTLTVPAASRGTVRVDTEVTHAADTAARGAYETRLIEPDGEQVTLLRREYEIGRYLGESYATDTLEILENHPGPFTALVAYVDGG